MNNNEAKRVILEADSCFCKHGAYKDCHSGCKYREALDAAVKALEQEPTTKNDLGVDCISRQAVLEGIAEWIADGYADSEADCSHISSLVTHLPSVTPQEPRWIPVSERLPDTDDVVLCWYEYYHWSHGKVLPEYGLGCYLRETSSWFGEVTKGKDARVIAWMPLPEPFMPQESEK